MCKRVLIWGIGDYYRRYGSEFRKMASAKELEIVGVVASHKSADTFDGLQWIAKAELSADMADWIVVMSEVYFPEILEEAVAIGFLRSRVVNISLLELSGFDWEQANTIGEFIANYIEQQKTEDMGGLTMLYQSYGYSWNTYKNAILSLKNHRDEDVHSSGADALGIDELKVALRQRHISIFASNCAGGVLYHAIGIQFLSPIINMWLSETDYLKMMVEPQSYLKGTLRLETIPYHRPANGHGHNNAYPLFRLGDIMLHMNHYTDIMQAAQKWYERSERVNWDDVVAIMFTDSPLALRRFEELPLQQKICFVPFVTDSPVAFCVDRAKTTHRAMWWVTNDVCSGLVDKSYHLRLLKIISEMKIYSIS